MTTVKETNSTLSGKQSPADFIRSNFGGVVNFPEVITRVPNLPFADEATLKTTAIELAEQMLVTDPHRVCNPADPHRVQSTVDYP